jgi:cytochrome P450
MVSERSRRRRRPPRRRRTVTTTTRPPAPPRPKGHPILGVLNELRSDAIGFLTRAHAAHGDFIRFRVGPQTLDSAMHPDQLKEVLVDRHGDFVKDVLARKLKALLGNGLLTNEGRSWLRQRRTVQPLFHRRRIAAFADTMVERTVKHLDDRWEARARSGEAFDVAAETMRLTLEIVGATLLRADTAADTERVARNLPIVLDGAVERARAIVDVPPFVPTPSNVRYRRAIDELDAFVYDLIAKRRTAMPAADEAGDDLLSMLLEARDEETGEGMTDRQVRDEVMTLVLAGHETTANALAWTFWLLATHDDVRERLERELDDVLGGRPARAEDLPALPYLRRVIDESLRLRPSVWGTAREAIRPVTVGGFELPAGRNILLITYLTHRHPHFWDDPERFDPDRFTPERSVGRHRYAYAPFGAGPRMCIGNGFALMEAQLILAATLGRYRLVLDPQARVALDPGVTLRPKHGLLMRAVPRGPVRA